MLKTGWLSPDGSLYECGALEHFSESRYIVDKYGYENPYFKSDDDLLLEKGWVHIGISTLGIKEWAIYWDNFLTEYQKSFLKPYFEDEERPMCLTGKIKWEQENEN